MEVTLFLGLFVFVITYLIHGEIYFRKLKQIEPETFAKIGSPSLFKRNQNPLPILGYFVSGNFLKVENASLRHMGIRFIVHFYTVLICMIAFLIYMILTGSFSS